MKPTPLFSLLLLASMLPVAMFLAGCGDTQAKQEDARILAEFRGPYFIAAADRRPAPGGPPLVPHVVYKADFNCLVCHAHQEFHFRGQLVPHCPHPERAACLQCHIPLQSGEQAFRFEMLGQGVAGPGAGTIGQPAKKP